MATIPTPEQGKPILDFSAGTFDGNSNLFQSRNGATEHVNGDDVADYVNISRIYNGLETTSKTPVRAINEINSVLADKMDKTNPTGTGSFSLNRKANTTTGTNSFAEGYNGTASGYGSHAEGYNTTASGSYSHAEGLTTIASGDRSHVEGSGTIASGSVSHAENSHTTARGYYSHAEGYYTIANNRSQHVMGEYNVPDDSTAGVHVKGNYVEIVGNGTADDSLSNARTLDWSGNEVLAGTIEAMGGLGVTLKQAVIDEIVDNGSYHVGDTIDISAFVLPCYATTTRLDIYVPLPKNIPTGATLTIAGNWRIILTNNSTLASSVVLNNAALSTIGNVSTDILEGGISIRVALNSGVISAWSLGNAFAMGSNSITIS